MDQENEKNVISIARVNVDKFLDPFSMEFLFNGTHILCQNNEKWPQQWIILPDFIPLFTVTCATSNFPAVTFERWNARKSEGYDM